MWQGGINCDASRGPAPVEGYNEVLNTWFIVPQKHIPPNGLGAVEIEGRVYFIINKFPVDSGIRIPDWINFILTFLELFRGNVSG